MTSLPETSRPNLSVYSNDQDEAPADPGVLGKFDSIAGPITIRRSGMGSNSILSFEPGVLYLSVAQFINLGSQLLHLIPLVHDSVQSEEAEIETNLRELRKDMLRNGAGTVGELVALRSQHGEESLGESVSGE